jgi:hypothetical protein
VTPLYQVRRVLGDAAWWSVTEGRDGELWQVGVEGSDRHALVVLGDGLSLDEALQTARKVRR